MKYLAAGALAVLTVPLWCVAQTYPNRPLRIVVPFAPGSSPDTLARIIGNKLLDQLGQQVIVDARPGASGVIAVDIARNAVPDGYTMLLGGTTHFATLSALKAKLPYDFDREFLSLTRVASVSNVVIVHPSLGVNTISDLVKLAKARPGQLNFGSSGNGSAPHLAGEMFNVLAGVQTTHVPYKGSVLALNDLIAGQIQYSMTSPVAVMPHAKSGRFKVIATTGAKRDPFLPDVPAVAETIPGFEITLWWGMAVPAKTPAPIVRTLHGELVKALQSSDVRELLARQNAMTHAESPAEFAAFIKAERERIARIGRQVGITLD